MDRFVIRIARRAGIVALFVDTLIVGPEGVIYATPPEQSRGVAFAGGYVFIRGHDLDLRMGRVTAKGSKARSGGPTTTGQFNKGGDGYVVLDVTAERVQAEFLFSDSVKRRSAVCHRRAVLAARAGTNHWVPVTFGEA